jgi:hypothetical protein
VASTGAASVSRSGTSSPWKDAEGFLSSVTIAMLLCHSGLPNVRRV